VKGGYILGSSVRTMKLSSFYLDIFDKITVNRSFLSNLQQESTRELFLNLSRHISIVGLVHKVLIFSSYFFLYLHIFQVVFAN